MTDDINIAFCREMLRLTRADLTAEQRRRLRGCWTYGYQRGAGDWEFQNPSDGFYWSGNADNAYDAKRQGIRAWLQRNYPTAD